MSHFLKLFSLFLAVPLLGLTSCEKKPASLSEGSPTPVPADTTSASFSSALTSVAGHLETNGSHFSITHIDEDFKQLATAVDGVLEIARQSSAEIPPNLRVADLMEDLGLSKIDAIGRSSRLNDGVWHNRFFIRTNGDRSGLLSVMGDEGSAWRAGSIASADADLVVEFELNLRRLSETLKTVSASFGEEAKLGIAEAMKQQIAGGAMTLADLFGKTDLRSTLIVSIDREARWEVADQVQLPTLSAAMCIERGMWLWKQFGSEIEADSEIEERDGLKIVKAPEEMETPMGTLRPVIVLDPAEDLIWISLTEAFLDRCRAKKDTLAGSDDFKAATAGFPAKGNGLVYVSADFCNEIAHQMNQVGDNLPENSEQSAVFGMISRVVGLPGDLALTHGYAWCVSNTDSGILGVANSMLPDKGYGMMSGIAPIAALSGMTAPMVIRQKQKADQVQAVVNLRQLNLALFEYETEHGSYPNELSDLVAADILDEEGFAALRLCKVDGGLQPLVYIRNRSSEDPNAIILHTLAPVDGRRAAAFIDGSVRMLAEHEFLEMIGKQLQPE